MHTTIVNIHIFANAVFTLIAIILCSKSLIGYLGHKPFGKALVYLEYGYLGFLYFGLILGIILYFFYHQVFDLSRINIQELQKEHTSRFWAIEHFSVMVFALMIAQIGKIFTSKPIPNRDKFKYALFYYGIATMIILISMSIYLYHKFQL
jgi:hypothetical protein